MTNARNHASRIEVLEPLVLMSAAAADVNFDDLGTGTSDGELLLATEAGGRIDGGGGADRLIGAAGSNALDAGSGDDQLISLRGDNVLTGGSGIDTAVYLDGASGDYTLQDFGFGGIVEVSGNGRADLLYSIERIAFRDGAFLLEDLTNGSGPSVGFQRTSPVADLDAVGLSDSTDGDDLLAALSAGEVVDGAAGNDVLIAVAGDNELLGGAGDDDFVTHRGRNTIDGGADTDRVTYAVERTDVFVTDLGNGSLRIDGATFSDLIRNVEWLDFDGTVIATENLVADAAMLPSVSAPPTPTLDVDVASPPIPVEPDGGIGDGAGPIPVSLPTAIPVEPDGGIGDGAGPIPVSLPTAIPVEPDGGIGDGAGPIPVALPEPIPVEPDGGIGDGAGPIPVALPTSVPVTADNGNSDDDQVTITSEDVETTVDPLPGSFPIEVTPTISGTDASEWISGTSADDVIVAGGGDDEIHVPVGNNQVDGGAGIDTLVIYEGYRAQYLFAVRSDGVTTISGPGLNGETVTVDLLNVERVQFNDGIVDLNGASTIIPEPPTSGSTKIDGTDNGEWIGGTEGNDRISAGGGDDEIYVALGENQIDGGAGTDTLLVYANRSEFTLANLGDGSLFMEGPGLNGETLRNTLINVEQIQFIDELVSTSEISDLPVTIFPFPLPGEVVAGVSEIRAVDADNAAVSPTPTAGESIEPTTEEASASLPSAGPSSMEQTSTAGLVFASEPQVLPVELDPEPAATTGFGSRESDAFGQSGSGFDEQTDEMMAMATAARGLLDSLDTSVAPAQLLTLFGEQLGIDLAQLELRDRLDAMLRPFGYDLDAMLNGDGFGTSA